MVKQQKSIICFLNLTLWFLFKIVGTKFKQIKGFIVTIVIKVA